MGDFETGLYYNPFRYYSSVEGMYTQQDPIGLEGGNPTVYAYVKDINWWIDPLGLRCQTPNEAQKKVKKGQGPKDVTRIDKPESSVPGSQWHAHGKNGGAIN